MILPWDMTWNTCTEYKNFLNWCGDICDLTEVTAIIGYHFRIIFSRNRSEKSFILWTINSIWLRLHQWRSLKITVRKFNVYLNWNPIKSRYICIVHHTLEKLTKSRSVKCSAILHATRLNEINIKRNMKSHITGKEYFINTTPVALHVERGGKLCLVLKVLSLVSCLWRRFIFPRKLPEVLVAGDAINEAFQLLFGFQAHSYHK